MSIWHSDEYNLEAINGLSNHTMASVLSMKFTAIGNDYLEMQMPVTESTKQPYGLLHGGASAALAETVGSVASSMVIDREKNICVGQELNCNHLRGKRDGIVTATARPLHLGATSHVWDIKITDEAGKLICVGRLTVAILKRREGRV
ncbi:MAG: hotdog fold thioesterase [Edaphocola sp.]